MIISVRPESQQQEIIISQQLDFKFPLSPSKQLSHLFNGYAQAINHQEDRVGSLFQKNFKRKIVESEEYFRRVIIYVHQNPDKHGYSISYKQYPFSSYPCYIGKKESHDFLNMEKTLDLFGGKENFLAAHDEFEASGQDIFGLE
ncbi:hypothetical protein [Gracilimonas sp.]|uniref:hypothetical protein n=1 Tax=Gracilimonas sp. TaxID=1974203 RepID=UPI002870DDDF|nr:hypothetical protein [Gracilimonas sp.]